MSHVYVQLQFVSSQLLSKKRVEFHVGFCVSGKMNADVLSLIGDCGLEITFKMAMVCSEWREAVEDSSHYVYNRRCIIAELYITLPRRTRSRGQI